MKIFASIADGNCPSAPSEDKVNLLVNYSCGDRSLSASVFAIIDLTKTEDEIRADVRAAVAAEAAAKLGVSVTSADVRLL